MLRQFCNTNGRATYVTKRRSYITVHSFTICCIYANHQVVIPKIAIEKSYIGYGKRRAHAMNALLLINCDNRFHLASLLCCPVGVAYWVYPTWDSMAVYSVYVVSRGGSLIYDKDYNVPKTDVEKTFSFPLDITLKVFDEKLAVDFGARDGIKGGL